MANILFVTQTAYPLGGVEVWLEDLAPALASAHNVVLGLVRGRRFHDPKRYLASRRVRVPWIEIDGRTGTTEGRVRAVERAIASTRADIVVPVNIADVLEAVRRHKARGRPVRMLYPLHGIGAEYLLDVKEFRGVIDLAAVTNRLAERALLDVAEVERGRLVYVTYGVPPPHRAPSFEPSVPLRLVYAGRLAQEQKRVRELVPLCRSLAARSVDFRLEIAGSGPEEAELRNALASDPRVHFLGVLSREELYERVYPDASALVLLSEWETGPIVAWEAMRHGATVITTDYAGRKAEKRLRDGENALVVPVGDVEAMADAIARLAADPEWTARLRRSALETAEREVRIEQTLTAWCEAFETCLRIDPAVHAEPVRLPGAHGRLERWAGRHAETIRHGLGLGMTHADSGAEWPHSYHSGDARRAAIDSSVLALEDTLNDAPSR